MIAQDSHNVTPVFGSLRAVRLVSGSKHAVSWMAMLTRSTTVGVDVGEGGFFQFSGVPDGVCFVRN